MRCTHTQIQQIGNNVLFVKSLNRKMQLTRIVRLVSCHNTKNHNENKEHSPKDPHRVFFLFNYKNSSWEFDIPSGFLLTNMIYRAKSITLKIPLPFLLIWLITFCLSILTQLMYHLLSFHNDSYLNSLNYGF